MPDLYIIAGPNGAGKTTASFTLLPQIFDIKEFVNADEIARGLSPFNPEGVAFEAGRVMLQRIEQLVEAKKTFAFETTLSTKSYVDLVKKCKGLGYSVHLIFLWLSSPEFAIERVRSRVLKGGHNIPEDVIRRRYYKGLWNFVNLFMPLCDSWIVADNTDSTPRSVVEGRGKQVDLVNDHELWTKILEHGKNIK